MRGFGRGFLFCLVLVLLAIVVLSWHPWSTPASSTGTNGGNTTAGGVTPTDTIGITPTLAPTNPPGNADEPTNGGKGQALPATVTGPAIIEYWTGDVDANNQAINCGVFKLAAGQTFTWNHNGNYWTYASDAAVNANWDAHVRAYQRKAENALCTSRSQPSSS